MNNIKKLLNLLPLPIVYAHCDIPCGIYDVQSLQLATHTVLRMTEFLNKLADNNGIKNIHDISRITKVKEENGLLVENELETLRNDYFKDDHYKAFPDLNNLISTAISQSVKLRQGIDLKTSEDLLEVVLKISEVFYKTKGVEPLRVKSIFPTEKEIVIYK